MGDKTTPAEHKSKTGGDGSGGSNPPAQPGCTDAYDSKVVHKKSTVDSRVQGSSAAPTTNLSVPKARPDIDFERPPSNARGPGLNVPKSRGESGITRLPPKPNVPDSKQLDPRVQGGQASTTGPTNKTRGDSGVTRLPPNSNDPGSEKTLERGDRKRRDQ
ncbi:hypothetical protein LTR37_009755 [Vermiconidia calcicola]|uniref:Uncharacterized protein n=1 Tax=Vermiconidia calcicola TaxID=1690605 RepID=A0ACC3N7H5_9PEZI|nr:hypothetical protein LTR37_009755 [Vermiconidia calcicola]